MSTSNGVLATHRPARVPGRAIETNPLIALAAGVVTADQVAEMDDEIEATEKYLRNLKAIRAAANADAAEAVAAEPVAALPPPPAPKVVVTEVKPAAPAAKPAAPAAGKITDPAAVAAEIKSVLAEHPDWVTSRLVDLLLERGVARTKSTLTQAIYISRSAARKAAAEAALTTPAPTEPAALPHPDSPLLAAAILTRRKDVAEYVFKQGLAAVSQIMQGCKLSATEVAEVLNHEWFEQHQSKKPGDPQDGKWRLTRAGRDNGLAWDD